MFLWLQASTSENQVSEPAWIVLVSAEGAESP